MALAPLAYRAAARALFAPFGGLSDIRRQALDAMQLRAGERVLELGCGPGELTAELLARGAQVDAVDVSEEMLGDAMQRAPSAAFEQADLTRYVPRRKYDAVLLSFVLHELDPADISAVVARAAFALAPSGRLAILDHWLPRGSSGKVWQGILGLIEPARVNQWLSLDLAALMRSNELLAATDRPLAGGRARLIVATRQA